MIISIMLPDHADGYRPGAWSPNMCVHPGHGYMVSIALIW